MKTEQFKSKNESIYFTVLLIGALFYLGYLQNGPYKLDGITFQGITATIILFLMVLKFKITTYLEIQNSRTLVNSGYRTFGKDTIDIFDIKYIYRYPNLRLRYYGSRMVFYIKDKNGKLRQSSLREVNYTNDTLVSFLKRIKEIRPTIELDPEYEKIIKGEMFLNDASENTVSSVEARLAEKGERWS